MQGPPGTGKTKTLQVMTEALLLYVDQAELRSDMGAVLCCAQTNAATDNILEGLGKTGRRVVRIGQPAMVSCSCHVQGACTT